MHLSDPKGYASRSKMLLVGSPKPDRPKARGQTKHIPVVV